MSEELKPCPFCGSNDLYVVQARIEEYHSVEPEISCKKCRYTIKLKELAIAVDESPETNADWWDRGTAKKWNTRQAEDALKVENERLKEAIKEIRNIADNGLDIGIEFIGAGLDGMTGGVEDWEAMKRARRKVRRLAKQALNKPDTKKGGCKVDVYLTEINNWWRCPECQTEFSERAFPKESTVFDHITESPDVLAGKLVYSEWIETFGKPLLVYHSTILGSKHFKSYAETIAATVA